MAHTHTGHAHGAQAHGGHQHGGRAEQPKANSTAAGGCTCPPPETCCDLICFERPNYFCGHLLTDADLKLEQHYFREKNKLYHRALHGHGVVCGLRLTCDHECSGRVRIDEGYAIDDCGNDLVVCEPTSFDVVAALRKKDYLVPTEPSDPCVPPEPHTECKVRQCFYIAICYKEAPAEFTTPFMAGCRPKLSDCEPTRIREEVYFDVLSELPEEAHCLDTLQARLEKCFEVFSKGPFAEALRDPLLKAIMQPDAPSTPPPTTPVPGQPSPETPAQPTPAQRPESYCEYFCRLRGLFLLYLRKHPDKYNCTLADDVKKLVCPDADTQRDGYRGRIRDVFCELLELVWQHVVSCFLGELVVPCSEPAQASCVVLGTVEVENDKVVRVCNCPRSYVWSFAHFCEVLVATVFGRLGCEEHEESQPSDCPPRAPKKHVCCRTVDFDCDWLVKLLCVNPEAPKQAGTELFKAMSMLWKGTEDIFDFTRPGAFAAGIFDKLTRAQAEELLARQKTAHRFEEAPLTAKARHPMDILRTLGLATPHDPLVLALRQGVVVETSTDPGPAAGLSREERARLAEEIKQAREAAAAANNQAQAATVEINRKTEELAALSNQLTAQTEQLSTLQNESAALRTRLDALERGPQGARGRGRTRGGNR